MRRINLFLSIGLIIATILILSCSGQKEAEMTKMIPKDSYLLLDMNLGKLHEKGQLKDFDKSQLYTQMMSLLGAFASDVEKYVRAIITDSDATGLDAKSEIYMFINDDYFGFLAPVKDKNKFNEFLKKNRAQGAEAKEPRKIDKFLGVGEENTLLAWDDNVLYALIGIKKQNKQQVETDFKKFATLTNENSITANPMYKEFNDGKKDISFLIDYGKLMKSSFDKAKTFTQGQPQFAQDKAIELYKDTYGTMFAEFNNDEINLTNDTKLSDELNKLINLEKLFKGEISDKLLKIFPKNSFAAYAASVDPAEALKSYKTMSEKLFDKNDTTNSVAKVIEIMSKYSDRFDGEVVMSITDFMENPGSLDEFSSLPIPMNDIPVFAIALGTKDNNIIESLNQEAKEKLIKVGNYYELPNKSEEKIKLYCINANNIIMISNDINTLKAVETSSLPENLTTSTYASQLKKGNFGYMNINFDTFPPVLKAKLFSDATYKPIVDAFNIFDVIIFEQDKSGKSGKSSIKFKKHNQNSFLTLIKTVEKLVGVAMAGSM